MILLEHDDGEAMLDMILHAKGVSQRASMWAIIIEAKIALFKAGIAHLNVEPRKVLISRFPKLVLLVDVNRSVVYKCFEFGRKIFKLGEPDALPISLNAP